MTLATIPFAAAAPAFADATKGDNPRVAIVVVAGEHLTPIPGAELVAVDSTGQLEVLAETNRDGVASVEREALREERIRVLLVCAEAYYCGAVRLDRVRLSSLDEYIIVLAPLVLP